MPNGTRIATQDNTGVRWNHKDPNLKSFRSTGPNGSVLGSGTSDLDWDHVETDADGKSVGFIDPGISFPAPFNDLFQSQNPFGSIVNGQFVSYSVDGIMVPKDYFAAMLDFAFGSQFGVVERQARLSRGRYLGSRYSYRDAFGQTHGTDRSGAITQAAEGNRTVIENRFWLVSDQSWAVNLSLIPFFDEKPEDAVNDAIGEASKKIAKDKCKNAIEGLLRKAFMEKLKADGVNYDKLSAEEKSEIDKFIQNDLTASKLIDSVKSATHVYAPDDLRLTSGDGHNSAETLHSGGKVTVSFFGGFFNQIMSGKGDIVSQIGPSSPPKPYKGSETSISERAHTIIHEGIHSIYQGFTDGFIGRFTGKKVKDKDLTKTEGSEAINKFVKDNCE